MFSGMFQDMDPSELAALLSCLVYDERNSDMNYTFKNQKLADLHNVLLEHGKRVFKVYQDAKINIDEVRIDSGCITTL